MNELNDSKLIVRTSMCRVTQLDAWQIFADLIKASQDVQTAVVSIFDARLCEVVGLVKEIKSENQNLRKDLEAAVRKLKLQTKQEQFHGGDRASRRQTCLEINCLCNFFTANAYVRRGRFTDIELVFDATIWVHFLPVPSDSIV